MSSADSPKAFPRKIRKHLQNVALIMNRAATLGRIGERDVAELALRVAAIHGHPLITTVQRSRTTAQRLRRYDLSLPDEVGSQQLERALDTSEVAALTEPETRGHPVRTYLERRDQLEALRRPYETPATKTADDLTELEAMIKNDDVSGDEVLEALRAVLNDLQSQVVSAAQAELATAYMTMLLTYVHGKPPESTQHAESFMEALAQQDDDAKRHSQPLDVRTATLNAELSAPAVAYLAECRSKSSPVPKPHPGIETFRRGVMELASTFARLQGLAAEMPKYPLAFGELANACRKALDAVQKLDAQQDNQPLDVLEAANSVLNHVQRPSHSPHQNIEASLRRQSDLIRSGPSTTPKVGPRQLLLGVQIRPWIEAIADAIHLSCGGLHEELNSYTEARARTPSERPSEEDVRSLVHSIANTCAEVAEHLEVLVSRYEIARNFIVANGTAERSGTRSAVPTKVNVGTER